MNAILLLVNINKLTFKFHWHLAKVTDLVDAAVLEGQFGEFGVLLHGAESLQPEQKFHLFAAHSQTRHKANEIQGRKALFEEKHFSSLAALGVTLTCLFSFANRSISLMQPAHALRELITWLSGRRCTWDWRGAACRADAAPTADGASKARRERALIAYHRDSCPPPWEKSIILRRRRRWGDTAGLDPLAFAASTLAPKRRSAPLIFDSPRRSRIHAVTQQVGTTDRLSVTKEKRRRKALSSFHAHQHGLVFLFSKLRKESLRAY